MLQDIQRVCTSTFDLANAPNQICDAAYWNSTTKTVAGTNGLTGTTMTRLNVPQHVFFDGNGYMYVVDNGNNRVQLFPPGK